MAAHYVEKDCDTASDTTLASVSDSVDTRVVGGSDLHDARSNLALRNESLESIRILPSQAVDDHSRTITESPSAFVETSADAIDELDPSPQSEPRERTSIDARIPGVSDDELARIKRQMRRKDI